MVDRLLRCAECGCWSDEDARGWAGVLGGGDEDDDDPELVYLYCPACAATEFGYRPEAAEGYV